MFPNLDAEQARSRMTNQMMADLLHISRMSYENKKKTGKFNLAEIKAILEFFNVSFNYLFAYEEIIPCN